MILQNFITDIFKNEYLSSVFNASELDKDFINEQVNGLMENEIIENQKIIPNIEWLFKTTDSTYFMIGEYNQTIYFMDSEGGFETLDCSLFNLPFLLYPTSPTENFNLWLRKINQTKSFMYYFDYCEKNNIELLPENLLWKEEIQKILNNNP